MKHFTRIITTVLAILCFGRAADAHEIRPARINFTFAADGTYDIEITANIEAIIANIGSDHEDTDESKNASQYNTLRALPPEKLRVALEEFAPQLFAKLELTIDGTLHSVKLGKIFIPPIGDLSLARDSRFHLVGTLSKTQVSMTWKWHESLGSNILRVNTPENPELYAKYLQAGDRSDAIPIQVAGSRSPKNSPIQSGISKFFNFLWVGFTHIVPKGLDHILFVLGLFLLNARMRSLLIQVTCFTVAHSITLVLGMLGIVEISPTIVEPLIAASIIFVCVENIYSDKLSHWRPAVVFAFGLLHGFGFAGVLTEFGLSSSHFVTGLVAFNIGVELGQLLVIAICFVSFGIWFRDKPWVS